MATEVTKCLVLQLQKCGEEFQAASVMAAPGRCLNAAVSTGTTAVTDSSVG